MGAHYGLRAYGPWDPGNGLRFNGSKLLMDPWATAIDRPFRLDPLLFDRDTPRPEDTAALMPKAIVGQPPVVAAGDRPVFDWDRQVIYELHVRGFSMTNPAVPVGIRGTFAGLGHPASIAHLQRLGVTTVEVMPSAAWVDERHLPGLGLSNYWGYNPIAFLAPDPRLAPGGWAEVRAAVDALHAAGLNVILDAVLNHSGESDELGPTLSLRGLDNAGYYRLAADRARYVDDAGCGNVLAMDRPLALRLGMDALRAWALYGGFDGFRLDLAVTLGRRDSGFDRAAPFLAAIEQDPVLSRCVMIAEPWDIGPGGYQLGAFPARWGEWNDRYRNAVRQFWRGDAGMLGDFTTRFAGSADVFAGRPLSRSINYVTAHDGFTLADLVAYEAKRNHANGEDNRDGSNDNLSWNNGMEGPSADPAIMAARARDLRALLATLLLSRGTPMLSMGDELGRTQAGNNNAYAQDNAGSWIDWGAADHGLADFTAAVIALRRALAPLFDGRVLRGQPVDAAVVPDVAWLDASGQPIDWNERGNHTLVAVLFAEDVRAALVFHADAAAVEIGLPTPRSGYAWRRVLDSAGTHDGLIVAPRSVTVFEEKAADGAPIRDEAPSIAPERPSIAPERPSIAPERPSIAPERRTGVPDEDLNQLAQQAGINPFWWDVGGGYHNVGGDTKRALLAAMRLPTATRADIRDSLARLTIEPALPPALTIGVGAPIPIRMGRPRPAWVTLVREDGSLERFRTDGDQLVLPPQPIGRHRLLNEERWERGCSLTVAPAACYLPPDLAAGFGLPQDPAAGFGLPPGPAAGFGLPPDLAAGFGLPPGSAAGAHLPPGSAAGARRFGIAAHLYSLRSHGDQGIGDFTTLARFATEAARNGAATIGLNPLHALFPHDRSRASPYNPSDRRFVDPIYIDVAGFPGGTGLPSPPGPVDYSAVWARKRAVLQAAFTSVADDVVPDGLRRFATFEAIAEVLGTPHWQAWPTELRHPESAAVAAFARAHRDLVRFHAFLQDLAESQLRAAAGSAARDGLSLGFYRDLAVGAAPDGAEAWSAQDTLMHGVSVGAPPDPFSAQGQIWCLPPPDPVAMRRDGFQAFNDLLVANMRHAGALRIDHVMGLRRLFVVPDGAAGIDGAYVTYPMEDLLGQVALQSQRAKCLVVGEDLGTVPEGMSAALAARNILSYSVLWFERRDGHLRRPGEWRRLAAACVSTHDLPTLAGWWAGADIAEKRALSLLDDPNAEADRAAEKLELLGLLRAEGLLTEDVDPDKPMPVALAAAIHAFVSATPSLLALVQADDLAGETIGVNLPGTDRERPNWRRRLGIDVSDLCQTPLARAILDAMSVRTTNGDDERGR
ncbi:MAG TPA: glycogen debranching protein GlgX [Rhodopila sp.]|nr:glycogen debranching protein GlgX [Rhodopila sp.]